MLERSAALVCRKARVAPPLALAAALLLCACAADDRPAELPFAPGPGQGVFLIVSDIHFDPFADPALVDALVASEVDAWHAIFESSKERGFAPYGSDSNYPLLSSALDAAARLLPRPDFVLYPGDWLAHEFQAKFDAAAGGGPEAYRRFVIRTMAFLWEELQAAFPRTPVYGTLGNADSLCGDYMIAPAGSFLAAVGELWAANSEHPEAFGGFGISGSYAVPHPTVARHDLIVLNDVFWSTRYEDRCNPEGGDPGRAVLAWLEWTLYRTRLRGRSASLLFHIPPGIDSFNASHGQGTCQANVTPYLKDAYALPFLALLEAYRDILEIGFAGHTHMDDFRVVSDAAGAPVMLTHITPAVSPIYQNNPAFGLVLYDRASGDLIDYATVYLTNLETAGRGEPARWVVEYTLREAYGHTAYDPTTASRIAQAIRTEPAVRGEYITFYPASTASPDPPIDRENWAAFACGQTELTAAAFAACYCGGAG
jgi:hypothetical protein